MTDIQRFLRTITVFTVLFLLSGPIRQLVYNNAPMGLFIKPIELNVEPVICTDTLVQKATLERIVRTTLVGDSVKELSLLKDNKVVDVFNFRVEDITFEKNDTNTSNFTINLPTTLDVGKYQWLDTIIVQMPNGKERTLDTIISNEFIVVKDCEYELLRNS